MKNSSRRVESVVIDFTNLVTDIIAGLVVAGVAALVGLLYHRRKIQQPVDESQKAEKGLIKSTPLSDIETLSPRHKEDEPRSKVEQHHITGPNVGVGSARDVHIYQSPHSATAEQKKSGEDWEVDEEFSLEPDEYRTFDLEVKVGDKLSGIVESEGKVSCYVLGPSSLQSFEDDYDFNSYWESENVTRVKVLFKPTSGHKFFFVVYRDEEAEEDVSVSVKLRTET